MAKRNRRNRERAGGRTLRRFAAAALVFLIPPGLGADSLNLTTWYPAPYGVYSQLRSTGNSYFAYQGGSVGIGTASPQHILDVAGADAQMVVTGTDQTLGGAVWVRNDLGQTLWLSNNGSTRVGTRYSLPRANMQLIEAQHANYFVIGTNEAFPLVLGTAQTERMRIAGSGNVGIGTTNPQSQLHIGGNANSQVSLGNIDFTGNTGQAVAAIQANESGGFGNLYFQANGWGTFPVGNYTPSTKMVILGTGNVGIGTTNPQSKLHIAGDSGPGGSNAAAIRLEDTRSTTPHVFRMAVDGNSFILTDLTAGYNAHRLWIDSAGRFGIGTTTPGARLQVGNSGDGTVALANAWNTFSSRRFKENVRPIGGALGKINRLRGVEFQWKGSGKRDMGVVAEEVGQVFPEIVDYETGGRDARGLDYSKLVAPLIEAVKELKSENDDLRKEIGELRRQVRKER